MNIVRIIPIRGHLLWRRQPLHVEAAATSCGGDSYKTGPMGAGPYTPKGDMRIGDVIILDYRNSDFLLWKLTIQGP
jgi:hypothetical protein